MRHTICWVEPLEAMLKGDLRTWPAYGYWVFGWAKGDAWEAQIRSSINKI